MIYNPKGLQDGGATSGRTSESICMVEAADFAQLWGNVFRL
jgi:hypothetical protein